MDKKQELQALRAKFGPSFNGKPTKWYTLAGERVVTDEAALQPDEAAALLAMQKQFLEDNGHAVTTRNAIRETDDRKLTFWDLTLSADGTTYRVCRYHLGENPAGFLLDGNQIIAQIGDGDILPLGWGEG